jgi:hypothetical protein
MNGHTTNGVNGASNGTTQHGRLAGKNCIITGAAG